MISEITSRAISKVIGMINKQTDINDKLRKLEILCIKINSAVEASKKHRITGTYLLKWQEKLKEAGIEGNEVLFDFRWRALTEASKSINHNVGTLIPLTYTMIVVSSIINYFHSAAKMLPSTNKDVQKLNSTVEMLEKLSADSEEFSSLIELQVLIVEEHAAAKRKKSEMLEKPSADNEEFFRSVKLAKQKKPDMLEKLSADNQFSRSVQLEVLNREKCAPAKMKKPVVICDRNSSRKRAHDCILDSTKVIESVKRVAPVRKREFHVQAVGSIDPTAFAKINLPF